MPTNSINNFIQQSFLTIPLKIVQSAGWNKNESSTTTKVNQVALSITLDKNSFEAILDQWTKNWWGTKNSARIPTQKKILDFFSNSKELYLNLAGSKLTSLADIFHFEPFSSKLKHLDLSKNALTSLPKSFDNLQSLTTLDLSKNGLTSLPESFGKLQALTKLDLSKNALTSLPKSFGDLQALTDLNLSENALTSLPKSFDNLQALTKLDLSKNELTSLPESFDKLQALTELYLSKNALTSLPESFGNLQALTDLYLRYLSLTRLPESFGNLQALITLNLNGSSLTSLPESIGKLQALTNLYLSYNSLEIFPESFGNLQALTSLSLRDNRTLSGLPMQLLALSRTCTIELTGCSLSQTVLERIREITTNPTYTGPRISFSISDRARREEESIEDSLKNLHRIAYKPFKDFTKLEKTPTLRSWLDRLSYIADYKKQGPLQKAFANTIIRYLELANEDPVFHDAFYAVIQGASETCGDRMSLSVLDLGIVHKLATINLKDTKALADFLIKGPWALDLLEKIARNKIPTLPLFDEIEVYLGYPIKLKEALNLPIDVQEMLFFRFSALKNKDLQEAKASVLSKQENQEERLKFLIGHDKWKEALSVNYAKEYEAILDKKIEASESEEPNYKMIEEKFNQELMELTKKALA